MDSYIARLLSCPKRNLGILALVALVFAYHALSVRMDNRMEVWLPEQSLSSVHYKAFLQEFGTEEFILIAFSLPDGLTREHLLLTGKLTDKLKKVQGIRRVWSLTEIFDNPQDYTELFKQIIAGSSFARNALISPSGKASGIIVILSSEGLQNRIDLLRTIKGLISVEVPDNTQAFIAGPPVINAELDSLSQRRSMIYYPILFVVCLFMLFILFRSLAGIVVPSLMMGLSLLMTLGWMGILNASLNIITIAVLPLVMVISLAYAVYFYNDYNACLWQNISPKDDMPKYALIRAFRHVLFPLFLSALTTAVGFSSLMVSDIVPVRNLGLFVALGVSSSFSLAITFLPLLLVLFPQPTQGPRRKVLPERLPAMLTALGRAAMKSKGLILIFCCLLSIIALTGVMRLSVETDALLFFPRESSIVQAYNFIEKHLTGVSPIEIIIERKEGRWDNRMPDPETIEKIKELQRFLSERDEIVTSKSIVEILQDKTMTDFLDILSISNERLLSSLETATSYFINTNGTATRVSVRAKSLASEQFQKIVEDIDRYLTTHFDGAVHAHVTGIVPMIVEMQNKLLRNLMQSFLIAFGVIFCVFLFSLRSFKKAVICMIGNLLPVLGILGFMGWFGVKLDVATVMIASIAIGIAVDDTVHFIMRLKQESPGAGELTDPILATLSSTGKSIVCTSLVTLCGFLVLCFSGFTPMENFGLLTGITIIFALLSDLIILPVMLSWYKVRF